MPVSSDFIEDRLIFCILRDIVFLQKFGNDAIPDLFHKFHQRYLCNVARNYFIKYNSLIPNDVFEYTVDQDIQSDKISKDEGKIVTNYYSQLMQKDYSAELNYIQDEFIQFFRVRNKELVLRTANKLYQEGKLDEVDECLQNALYKPSHGSNFYHYFNEVQHRVLNTYDDSSIICPTCIGDLDEYLSEGGICEGELAVILAPTNRGKSIALIHIAKAALIHGLKVYFISLEMSIKKMARRLDSALIGKAYKTLYDDGAATLDSLVRKARMFGDSIIFKHYAPRLCSPVQIRSDIAQMKFMQFEPDVVIIDYATLLDSGRHYHQRWEEMQIIYEDLRGIGTEYQLPIITAAQTNRDALSKIVINLDDFALAFGPAMTADIVVALCQTPGEEADNKMRVALVKNRDDTKGTVEIINDFTRMQFSVEKR